MHWWNYAYRIKHYFFLKPILRGITLETETFDENFSFKIQDYNTLVSFQVFVSYNNEEEELRTKMVDNLKTALRTQPMRLIHI